MIWYKKVSVLLVASIVLMGCREVNRYEYEAVKLDLLGGEVTIEVIGNLGENYTKDGNKKLDYGGPYTFAVDYVVFPSDPLHKLEIKDIQLTGVLTNSKHTLADIQSDDVGIYGERKLIRVGSSLSVEEYEYQDYKLSVTVVVYQTDSEFKEQKISVFLKTKYSQGRSSDWFDRIMSV